MAKLKIKRLLQPLNHTQLTSTALLILRLIAGTAFMYHGWGKIQNPMHWMGPDAPVPGFLQFLAALSEFGGGLAWVVGFLTPLASLGICFTMAVATSMHAFALKHSFVASKMGEPSYELALVYLGVAFLFFAEGPGKFSLDSKVFGKRN